MAHHRSLGFDKETARNALLSARNDTALAVEYAIHDTHDPEDEDDECPVCVGRTENALMRRWLRDQGVRPRSAVVRAEERQEAEAEVEGEASTSTLARGGPALVPQHAERPATAVRVRTVNPFVTTGSTRSASLQRVLMPIPRFDNTPAAARTATLSDPNSNDPKGSLPTRGSSRVFSTVYPWARIDVQQSAPAPSISASNIGRAI
jgi:hypothetical protein